MKENDKFYLYLTPYEIFKGGGKEKIEKAFNGLSKPVEVVEIPSALHLDFKEEIQNGREIHEFSCKAKKLSAE